MIKDMVVKTTIHGIVIPAAWSEKGAVASVAIATYHEKKYLVVDKMKIRELLPLLCRRVSANGILRKSDTIDIIEIDNFRLDESKI